MGLLSKRTRIFDTILTEEGRRQLAEGKLNIAFFSFTDDGIYYSSGSSGVVEDASSKISFEACGLPQDQIVFEADDSGKLMPRKGTNCTIQNGQMFIPSGSLGVPTVVNSSATFASLSQDLLNTYINNFNKLYILNTADAFDEDYNEFILNKTRIDFDITADKPIPRNGIREINVDHVESFMFDKRLSNIPNFKYLPPVNTSTQPNKKPLGNFPSLNQAPILRYTELQRELDNLKNIGYEQVVKFTESSRQNNMIGQFFELNNNNLLKKLDVIDFGIFETDDVDFPSKHIFFIGKVFTDSNDTNTFVNLFVLIAE